MSTQNKAMTLELKRQKMKINELTKNLANSEKAKEELETLVSIIERAWKRVSLFKSTTNYHLYFY